MPAKVIPSEAEVAGLTIECFAGKGRLVDETFKEPL
jgi:hypothetical protein